MGKKAKNSDLGRALAKRQEKKSTEKARWNTPAAQIAAAAGRHTNSDDVVPHLASVLDATDLEELMLNATLANQSFSADRYPTPLSSQSVVVVTPGANANSATDQQVRRQLDASVLAIPRRPAWHPETTYQTLMSVETDSFLKWRRQIASIETEYNLASVSTLATTITPFEKNVEVWRQLWRVVERSDIILQIVDARNPLLYFCTDLVRYVVDEMQRAHVIVMNKSDLLTSEMITTWQTYFQQKNINVIFFSAFTESVGESVQDERVLNARQLVDRLECVEHRAPTDRKDGRVVVGMCGYPNVGKSSTINVLLECVAEPPAADDTQSHDTETDSIDTSLNTSTVDKPTIPKRVAVSATPGKTKHFQTLPLTDQVMLCDCPGLVFPNFSSSKAELICAGVLSIDNMRGDFLTPVSLIASRIPAPLFEGVYGLRFSPTVMRRVDGQEGLYVSGEVLLDTHARARGFMTDHGRPDASRSARVLLKDFVNGRLVYAHAPSGAGESGIGAAVFSKKGKLVHERKEVTHTVVGSTSLVGNPAGVADGTFDSGGAASADIRAFVGASKKGRGKEFVRVERSFA